MREERRFKHDIPKTKKILLAIDGSDYALGAVRYVTNTLPPRNTEVVLFHDHNKIPESYWNLERKALPGGKKGLLEILSRRPRAAMTALLSEEEA